MNFEQDLCDAANILSIPIDTQQSQLFLQYSNILDEWNRTTNLTAIEDARQVVVKHFIDSIMPVKFGLPSDESSVLDVGSGAGFPSIPLKIMKPSLSLTLLEPNSKKMSFLLYLIGTFRLENVAVRGQTLKQFVGQAHDVCDHVVVRAVNFSLAGSDLLNALKEQGSVLAYRSTVMMNGDIPSGFVKTNEWSYDLPFECGARVLTELSPATVNVPRGTRSRT